MWRPVYWHNINLNFLWKTRLALPLKIHKNIFSNFLFCFPNNEDLLWLEDKSKGRLVRGIEFSCFIRTLQVFPYAEDCDFWYTEGTWFPAIQVIFKCRGTWLSVKLKEFEMAARRHQKDRNESEYKSTSSGSKLIIQEYQAKSVRIFQFLCFKSFRILCF